MHEKIAFTSIWLKTLIIISNLKVTNFNIKVEGDSDFLLIIIEKLYCCVQDSFDLTPLLPINFGAIYKYVIENI